MFLYLSQSDNYYYLGHKEQLEADSIDATQTPLTVFFFLGMFT